MIIWMWRFMIDGRNAGPLRDKADDAYQDAVNAGWALRRPDGRVILMRAEGAEVVCVQAES
jgi:hypothetical protein